MKSPVKITVVTSASNLKRIRELYNQVEADVRPLHTGFTSGGSIIWEGVDTPFTGKTTNKSAFNNFKMPV